MSPVVEPEHAVALATRLHTLGLCGEAVRIGGRAWAACRNIHGADHPGGILIAVPYIAILISCDRTIEGLRVLGQLGPALPPPEHPARHTVADWACTLITATTAAHQPHCARTLDQTYQLDTRPRRGRHQNLGGHWYDYFL